MNKITQEDIDKAYNTFRGFDKTPPAVIPTPTRSFEIGERVKLGGLDEVHVAEILFNSKAYRLDFIRTVSRNEPAHRDTGIWWWFDVEKLDFCSKEADELFSPYLPGQVSTTSIDSLVHSMAHSGLVCDPRYQRGYVWTLENQQNLIDSIFNRVNIGSIIFSRHSGYLHDGSDETVTYINLDGEEVTFLRNNDYTQAVIDGQQRLTTIWRFITNQFQYKGHYWKDLHFIDQNEFNNTLLSTRIFNEDDVPYKDVLRMFINVNKGVPQDPTHLEEVEKEFENLG